MDKNNINWERCSESFKYNFEGFTKRYIPDFYLPDSDKYIEIKGFETKKDRAKWEHFPEKLEVLKEKQLKELGVI